LTSSRDSSSIVPTGLTCLHPDSENSVTAPAKAIKILAFILTSLKKNVMVIVPPLLGRRNGKQGRQNNKTVWGGQACVDVRQKQHSGGKGAPYIIAHGTAVIKAETFWGASPSNMI